MGKDYLLKLERFTIYGHFRRNQFIYSSAIILILICISLFYSIKNPVLAEETQASILSNYDFTEKKPLQFELNKNLQEISGLAVNTDNHFLTHNDERGVIYKISSEDGEILSRFYFGMLVKKADFEGIARTDSFIYLVTSKGQLIQMPEGENNTSVDFEVFKTGLSKKYNIEGLCHDPETSSLLLMCKEYPGRDLHGFRAVYAFSLKSFRLDRIPRFIIDRDSVMNKLDIKSFKPSGIERVPQTGSFLIIAAQGNAIVEISSQGKILGMRKLNKKWHQQPEGITITDDQDLIIADEGKKGILSVYKSLNR